MDDNLNTQGAAEYLGSTPHTLNTWRYLNKGPKYVRMGRKIMYRRADLDAWMDANTVTPAASA